jgi:beta-lysine 5,6-aminomutase alpha subunit
MQSKLNLDAAVVAQARARARTIAVATQKFIDRHTTVAVERAVLRLLGVDGIDAEGVPLPNVLANGIQTKGKLALGAAAILGNAHLATGLSIPEIAVRAAAGALDPAALPPAADPFEIRRVVTALARATVDRIKANRARREDLLTRFGDKTGPLLYVIVATGNIFEDITQARAAAKQGADVIAVIRTTGQSLLDYVPFGATTEGFGGTYATQENFRLMRAALDEEGETLGRYIRLCNYCSGLCMPEIAAMGALERLDMMLNDAMYGVLFRDINMRRTFVDQYFSRAINAYAGIIINTGEDNYMTTVDPVEHGHTVLASQFVNEAFARRAGLASWQIGLGHVFCMDPALEDGLLLDLAQAALTRAVFPDCTLKYMPQTRYKTGNIFASYAIDVLHNLTSVTTGQNITLLGMLTEAIHTPYLQDRYLAVANARYVLNATRHLGGELAVRPDGRIAARARDVLDGAVTMLEQVDKAGLMTALEQGLFAGIRRGRDAGKGGVGVVERRRDYYNPVLDLMLAHNQAVCSTGTGAAGCPTAGGELA